MANNLQRGFTLECDRTLRKRVNCRDCIHADSDGSCNKRGFVFREDGTAFWKSCPYFFLDRSVANAEEKALRVVNQRNYLSLTPADKLLISTDAGLENAMHSKNYFNTLSDNKKGLFRRYLKGEYQAKMELISFVPVNVWDDFYTYLSDFSNPDFAPAVNQLIGILGKEKPSKDARRCIRKYVLAEMRPKTEEMLSYNQKLQPMILKEMFIYYLAHLLKRIGCLE